MGPANTGQNKKMITEKRSPQSPSPLVHADIHRIGASEVPPRNVGGAPVARISNHPSTTGRSESKYPSAGTRVGLAYRGKTAFGTVKDRQPCAPRMIGQKGTKTDQFDHKGPREGVRLRTGGRPQGSPLFWRPNDRRTFITAGPTKPNHNAPEGGLEITLR